MYDILADLINAPAGADSNIVSLAGVIVTLVIVWFLDCIVRLFKV